jgi:hypothetical protein
MCNVANAVVFQIVQEQMQHTLLMNHAMKVQFSLQATQYRKGVGQSSKTHTERTMCRIEFYKMQPRKPWK